MLILTATISSVIPYNNSCFPTSITEGTLSNDEITDNFASFKSFDMNILHTPSVNFFLIIQSIDSLKTLIEFSGFGS